MIISAVSAFKHESVVSGVTYLLTGTLIIHSITSELLLQEQTTNIGDGNNAESQSLGEDNNITEKLDINESLEKDNNGIENLDTENRDVSVESTVSVETSVIVGEVMVSDEVRKQYSQTNCMVQPQAKRFDLLH